MQLLGKLKNKKNNKKIIEIMLLPINKKKIKKSLTFLEGVLMHIVVN